MQTIVKSLGEFLNLLIQAFNLSAIFPSVVFMLLLHRAVFPLAIPGYDLTLAEVLNSGAHLTTTIIFTVLLAYFLDAANMKIIRFFEGYSLKNVFPFDLFLERNQQLVVKTLRTIRRLEHTTDMLIERAEQEKDIGKRAVLVGWADALSARTEDLHREVLGRYPEDTAFILPTDFGNVIAGAEQYPYKLFGMDSVTLWPFLRPILTEEHYAEFIVREKAVMDFLLNLIVVLGVFLSFFVVTELWVHGFTWAMVVKSLIILFGCWILSRLAVVGAKGWGVTVRTAFIRFRDDLRQVLRLPQPHDYESEREMWESVSVFLRGTLSDEEVASVGQELFRQTVKSMSNQVVQGVTQATY